MEHNNTILIIDDDVRFRIVIKEMIWSKYPELKILEADTVKSAIGETKSRQPDFIVLDIDFDVDTRIQLIRDIKSSCPEATILALSGNDTPEFERVILETGVDHFLAKFSCSGKQIMDLIESTLSKS